MPWLGMQKRPQSCSVMIHVLMLWSISTLGGTADMARHQQRMHIVHTSLQCEAHGCSYPLEMSTVKSRVSHSVTRA